MVRYNCFRNHSPRTVFRQSLISKFFLVGTSSDRSSKSAFTLIEMVIAIAILALLTAIVVPNLMQRSGKYERTQFTNKLNALSQFTWQHAITTGQLHRIFFNIRKRFIIVEQATGQEDPSGQPEFKPVRNAYLSTDYIWPKQLTVQTAFVDGKDIIQLS